MKAAKKNKNNMSHLASKILLSVIIFISLILKILSKNNTIIIEVDKIGGQKIIYSEFKKNLFVYINEELKYESNYYINVESINDTIKLVWNISLITCENMFKGLTNIKTINFIDFDFSLVTSMRLMFYGCINIKNIIFNLPNTSNVRNMYRMFYNCQNLISLNLTGFDTSNVISMTNMFYNCQNLISLNLTGFDTSNVIYMNYMFFNCKNLEELILGEFKNTLTTKMVGVFSNCTKLKSLDLSKFYTPEAISMYKMFLRDYSLTSLDLSSFDTSNVMSMDAMFYGCKNLIILILGHFRTNKVKFMNRMFYYCSSLKYLDFRNINTNSITKMDDMFYKCSSLKYIDLYYINKQGSTTNMFKKAAKNFTYCINNDSQISDIKALLDTLGAKNNCSENQYFNVSKELIYLEDSDMFDSFNIFDIDESDFIDKEEDIFEEDNLLFTDFKKNDNIENTLNTEIEMTFISDEFIKCDNACLTCFKESENNNTNCKECNTTGGYYPIYGENNSNCFNNITIKSGFYLDKNGGIYTWNKCYEKCETCNSGGNDTNMNCLSCKSNLINNSTNQIIFFELSDNGNCIEECPYNTFIIPNNESVSNYPNETYKFSFNHSCLNNCSNDSQINELKNESIFKTVEKTTIDEFKTQILSNISNFVNSSKIINGSNFLAVVLSSDDMKPEDQIKLGISAIDLGNCTEVLKEHYNLSKKENLIILNIESKKEESKKNETSNNNDNSFNLGKSIQLEVYDFSGRKLDLSVCKEEIKVMKYIGDVTEELNIKSAINLADKGIDVFNPQDDFFNDICHPYNTEGKDIILKDRREDIYQNATFCEAGCTYRGMDYNLMVANCICGSSILQKDDNNITKEDNKEKFEVVNFKSITKSFIASLLDFNYEVTFCYNLILDIQYLIKNYGFYSLFGMFLLQIIFYFIYLSKKLKPIRNFMLIFDNNNNNNDKKVNQNTINNININNKIEINESSQQKKDKISIQTSLKNKEKQSKNIKQFKKKTKHNKRKNKKNQDLLSLKESPINNSKSKKEINLENNSNNIKNILENENQPNYLNIPIKKDSSGKLIVTRNIDDKTGVPNYSKNIRNNASNKKMKLIEASDREEIISKKQIKSIVLKNNEINDNNNEKKYNIKSNRRKHKEKNILNKKEEAIPKRMAFLETIADKQERKNKDNNEIKLSVIDNDLQDMDYEEAINYDKRSILRIYLDYLIDTQIILGTFCTDNYLNLFVIKLSFFIFTFQISFFLNAFFYTDEYISNAYHNDGVLDFFSGLPKSIYSFLATLITTNLLRMLSNSQNELKNVIKKKRLSANYRIIINQTLNKLKIKLIIYFIIVFFLEIFCLYYVTAFCAVYRFSQKYWFFGCLESFAMDSLVALIVCIFLSFLRYISIKKRIKCFYILANIIGTFL